MHKPIFDKKKTTTKTHAHKKKKFSLLYIDWTIEKEDTIYRDQQVTTVCQILSKLIEKFVR